MLKWLSKRKWIALCMVAVMLLTLLPVNINWANNAIGVSTEDVTNKETASTPETEETEASEETEATEVLEETEAALADDTEVIEDTTRDVDTEAIEEIPLQEETYDTGVAEEEETSLLGDVVANPQGSLGLYITSATIKHKNGQEVTESNPAQPNETIYIDYKFDLSEVTLEPGFQYTLNIDSKYCSLVNKNGEPLSYEGTQIASYDISSDGKITVTFNENITNKQGVLGEFWVGCSLSAQDIEEEASIEIDVTDNHLPAVEIPIYQESKIPEIAKSNYVDANGNIVWQIKITRHAADLTGAEVTDTLDFTKLNVNPSAITVKAEKNYNPVSVPSAAYSWNGDYSKLTFHSNVDCDYVYIQIPTTIKADKLPDEDKSLVVDNTAGLKTSNGQNYSATSSYTYTTNRIEKSGSYDKSSKQTTWTIKVNNNNEQLDNVVIADVIPTGFEMVAGSMSVSPALGTSPSAFPVSLGNINKSYTITYKTKAVDGSPLNGTMSNTASIEVDGSPKGSSTSNVSNEVGSYIEKSGSYDWTTHRIKWTVVVNNDHLQMTNGVITDTVTNLPKHEIITEDFSVTEYPQSGSPVKKTFEELAGSITLNAANTEFKYTLPASTTSKYEITYWTVIDASSFTGGNTNGAQFSNTANIKAVGIDDTVTSTTSPVWTPITYLTKKGVDVDYSTNEITWEAVVNEGNYILKDVTVEDTVGADLKAPTSVDIYRYEKTTDTWGNVFYDYVKKETRALTPSGSSVTISLGDIDSKYKLIYRTKITTMPAGTDKEYENSATVKSNGLPKAALTSKQKVTPLELSKSGTYTQATSSITWFIDINREKQTMAAAVISDTLDMNINLDGSSVKLYKVGSLNADGTVNTSSLTPVSSGWSYTYNALTHYFEIKMPVNTSDTYRLEYKTTIAPDANITSVSNSANFKGQSPTKSSTSTINDINNQLSGGVISYIYKTLRIIKEDAESGAKLEGAVFSLYDKSGNCLGDLDPTDANGESVFKGVIVGREYTLIEKSAPTGYAKDSTAYNFKVTSSDTVITYTIKNVKQKVNVGEIAIYKVDDASPSQPVAGAKFGLWYSTNTSATPDMEVTTDDSGEAHFYNVDYDKAYKIKEIYTPEGYIPSAVEKGGTLTATNQKADYTFVNERKIGSLKVKKQDDAGYPLKGAKISLYKKNILPDADVLIDTKTTTATGELVFSGLEYGTYYLVEDTVPEGYKIGTDTYVGSGNTIVIDSNVQKEQIVKNYPVKATVNVKKTDKKNAAISLKGAEFSLYSVSGSTNTFVKKIATGADGTASFGELAYGKYLIKETKAPEGYILDSGNIKEIEITGEEVTSVSDGIYVAPDGTITYTLSFADEEENGAIQFTKEDENGNAMSTGVVFTLYDEYGTTVIATKTPTSTGLVRFSNLKWGTYILRETSAPEGYNRYPDDIKIKVDSNTGYAKLPVSVSASNVIVNTKKQVPFISFKFKKTDGTNPLPGAVFAAYLDSATKPITTAISGADGTVYFKQVSTKGSGSYSKIIIKEYTAPAGFLKNDTVVAEIQADDFSLYADPDEDNPMDIALYKDILAGGTYVNQPVVGRIELTKTQTGAATEFVAGATYGLYSDKACTTLVTGITPNPAVTDVNGKIVFSNVPYGVYYIKETVAAAGYYIDDTVYKVAVTKHYDSSDISTIAGVSVTDDKIYGKLIVTKRDKATNQVVSGATLELYEYNAGVYTKVSESTGVNGVYTFDELDYTKTYYVKEKTAPEGYLNLPANANGDGYVGFYTFDPSNDYVATGNVLDNKITGKVQIHKYDSSTTPLQGAEFTITYPDGSTKSVMTDASGTAEFTDLPYVYGDEVYTLKETRAPSGYVADETVYKITNADFVNMTGGVLKDLTVHNETKAGEIRITKKDGKDGTLLPGVEFKLYKYDPVAEDYGTTPVATAVTNNGGVAVFNLTSVTSGDKYKAVETKSCPGYLFSKNNYHIFTMLGGVTNYSWSVTNTKVVASLEVTKVDKDTQEVLEGAEFTLYDAEKQVIDKKTTGVSGKVQFSNLSAGAYFIQETREPEGYTNNYQVDNPNELIWYPVVIKDGSNGDIVLNNYKYTLKAENTKIPTGKISIRKKDAMDGAYLAGAEFTIYQGDGVTPVPAYSPSKVVTDENGIAVFDGLLYGDYVIKETKAPEGYKTPTYSQAVTVSESSSDVQLSVDNDLDAKFGSVEVAKVDKSNHKIVLEGAEFTIYNAADEPLKTITTDEQGKAKTNLVYGSYKMKETKAPKGYEKSDIVFTFQINDVSKILQYTVENTLVDNAKVAIYKIDDSKKENPLKGAKFELSLDGKVVASGKTDRNGYLEFTNLKAGTYVLKETKAPSGYQIAGSAKQVVIEANTKYSYTFVNKKKKETTTEQKTTERKTTEKTTEQKTTAITPEVSTETETTETIITTSKKTGDASPIDGAIRLFILSMAGLGGIVWMKGRRRKDR